MKPTQPLRPAVIAAGLVLAILWFCSLVQPPSGTTIGLDQSWRIGITLAAEQHLRFGQDIVFTFGPLGYALQGISDPPLAAGAAAFAALLAAATVGGVATALAGRRNRALKGAFLLSAVWVATALPLDSVAAVAAVALVARAARHPRTALAAGLAVGAIGLAGLLSKYTLGADALAAATAAWAVDAIRGPHRRRRTALFAAAGCWSLTVLGLAAAFGFSPHALTAYLRGAAEISNGYSAAMASSGPAQQVAAALALGACILGLCVAAARERKLGLAAAGAVILFLTWKHGFVRQDGHVIYYFATAAALAPLLGMMLRRTAAVQFAFATTVFALTVFGWTQQSLWSRIVPVFEPQRIARGIAFLRDPAGTVAELAAGVPAALAPDRLQPQALARLRDASVDVLPWETALVAAGGLRWAPLPVFQTYSAYTPFLDELDRDALATHGAAFELYRYEGIDGRFPFADAPATVAELACRYALEPPSVSTAAATYLVLRRAPGARCVDRPAGEASAALNQPVAVPAVTAPQAFVTASFALRPALATNLRTLLLRGRRVDLAFRFADGTRLQKRVVASTLADGVIVSAVPRDAAEAEEFFAGRATGVVKDVSVVAAPGSYVVERVTFTLRTRVR